MARKPKKQFPEKSRLIREWDELKQLIHSMELDAHKNAHGFYSAGVRFRHGLRMVKRKAHSLLMMTMKIDRVACEHRKEARRRLRREHKVD